MPKVNIRGIRLLLEKKQNAFLWAVSASFQHSGPNLPQSSGLPLSWIYTYLGLHVKQEGPIATLPVLEQHLLHLRWW